MSQSQITIYSDSVREAVVIDTPVGACFVTPQVAIEITVSLMRAALAIDPNIDADAITDAFIAQKKETVQ